MRHRARVLPTRRSMAGVSLVELMIAVTLGLMVLATLASVFASTSASRNELERTSRQIENGRFAMELMGDDLRLAGFYGELAVNAVTTPRMTHGSLSTPNSASGLSMPMCGWRFIPSFRKKSPKVAQTIRHISTRYFLSVINKEGGQSRL